MNNLDYKARQKFIARIKEGMLGPGSDTWGLPIEEEIISDFPLLRYFTGVLFPERTIPKTQFDEDSSEVKNETADDSEIDPTKFEKEPEETENFTKTSTPEIKDIDDIKINQNHFFPNNIGITICVDNKAKKLNIEFSFGVYYQPSCKETKIKISEAGYLSFFNEKIPYQLPFKEKLKYDSEFMYIEKPLEGYTGGGKNQRSGEYKAFDEFKRRNNLIDSPAKYFVEKLDKLISRKWKRKEIVIKETIPIKNTNAPIELNLAFKSHNELRASYNVKTFDYKGKKYVKIQLINTSKPHPRNKFSNKKEELNAKCLFQSKIKVISNHILPYKDQNELFPFDKEAEILNFIYRDVKGFGIGHNCSTNWEGYNPTQVETTFLPKIDILDVKNNFDDLKDPKFDEALNIKNLSNFGLDKKSVIKNLIYFIGKYETWINKQKEEKETLKEDDKVIAQEIIEKQVENLIQLKNNIDILEKNDKVFQAFQLTNLAMFIQLIVSNDKNLGKEEKELSEVNSDIEYNSIEFFKNYNFQRLSFIPKYRPFQLAFLILSIDGIVNKKSRSRKEIVNLIWFPTGGGKTEAYLAVAAFTIIWRRLTNDNGFGGTTVIMRYTLRLLTAQQFERASRLISALEFLRNQGEFKNILKSEPITIGLWIGKASTPNKLKEAKKRLEYIENECDRQNGNPVEKNVFQVSSCPWCGTKLITKDSNGKWNYGFEESKSDFKIYCLNQECAFHSRIPVQVVDELLYKNPPTLLFGTVDKFAMLAWREEAFKFFNTHDKKKLPPDLIIQDELHLLSGPLGSITGIFESIIELLSTKNGDSPLIIASTATTRNTYEQVKKLYGNRKVNIFPPTGINHNASFFAKVGKSKRKYIGFFPTGKTSLDTQLQLLAHLLVARLEIYSDKELRKAINDYWTIVSYYNSLKNVGKISNKVGDEITAFTGYLQTRLSSIFSGDFEQYKFNFKGLLNRTEELTGRIESEKIKSTLKMLEEEFTDDKITKDENGRFYLNDIVDLILATNMISVGIDISRLNIMLINGMPKNVAEYIQASSRIGRKTYGLVITLLDANRAREKSYFEHFKPFHQAFYKSVEPLSVTPFTENTLKKMVSSLLISFIRQNYPGELNLNNQARYFTKEKMNPLIKFIKERFKEQPRELEFFETEINRIADDWITKIQQNNLEKYDELLRKPSERISEDDEWILMQSMREIDTSTFIQIKELR